MSVPFKCPICNGRGTVHMEGNTSTALPTKTCHGCGGTGIVWSPDLGPVLPIITPAYPMYQQPCPYCHQYPPACPGIHITCKHP